jgi:electron transfer flavoprotein alpha subunit
MAILVIAEHDNAGLKAASLNTISVAQKLGGDIHVLVAGNGCEGACNAAAKVAGVAKVLCAAAPHYEAQLAENVAALVVATVTNAAGGYSHILAPATSFGKNVAPRVAALLDVAMPWPR